MRASGTAGIIALALTVGAAGAQTPTRSAARTASGRPDAIASRSVAPLTTRLPGALATAMPAANVEIEQLQAQSSREQDDEDAGAFWPTFFGVPGGEGSGRPAGALAVARRGAAWRSFYLPGFDLVRRAIANGAALRVPGAARVRLGLLGTDDWSEAAAPFRDAIGADAGSGQGNGGQSGEPHGRGFAMRALHASEHASFNRELDAPEVPGVNVPGRTESAAQFDYSLGTADHLSASLGALPTTFAATSAAAAAVTVTPEPASLVLLGTGVAAVGAFSRRRRTH